MRLTAALRAHRQPPEAADAAEEIEGAYVTPEATASLAHHAIKLKVRIEAPGLREQAGSDCLIQHIMDEARNERVVGVPRRAARSVPCVPFANGEPAARKREVLRAKRHAIEQRKR